MEQSKTNTPRGAAKLNRLIDFNSYPLNMVLRILLKDRTTGENIIWATDNYSHLGNTYHSAATMRLKDLVKLDKSVIQPRVYKTLELQKQRTKVNAEVFTPKVVVKMMVDMLEENNPGCFDDPDKTFIDLYMKSGLYIAEIVKRLFRNSKMKALYPDNMERLKHIFKHQVYGLAPTEIIYNIAKNFVLGFDDDLGEIEHNLKPFDATPYAADGTLSEKLDELFKKQEKIVLEDNALDEDT